MFTLHSNNIPQIKATIKAFEKCYFHGDGNLYVEESDSDFRQNFSNPKAEGSQYRILFTDVKQVPSTVEELQKKLMESRGKEIMEGRLPKSNSPVKTVKVEEAAKASPKPNTQQQSAPTIPAAEIPTIGSEGSGLTEEEQLQQMIAAEEAAKESGKKKNK